MATFDRTPRSPYRAEDGGLTAAGAQGRQHFDSLGCGTCHPRIHFTDSPQDVLHDIGTGGSFDAPTLKGIWGTAPYLHDGRADTLEEVFDTTNAPAGTPHASARTLVGTMWDDFLAYLRQIDDREIDATHFWMFNGTAEDLVGSNDGTFSSYGPDPGDSSPWRRFLQAAVFDGSSHIGLGTLNLGSAFTITLWVAIDPSASGAQTLLANVTSANNLPGFRLQVNTSGTTDGKVFFHSINGGVNSASTSAGAVDSSGWYQVTVTRNAGTCRIYVNGKDLTADSSVHTLFGVSQNTRFGSLLGGADRLKGMLDQVRVFNRVLSSHEIEMLASE